MHRLFVSGLCELERGRGLGDYRSGSVENYFAISTSSHLWLTCWLCMLRVTFRVVHGLPLYKGEKKATSVVLVTPVGSA